MILDIFSRYVVGWMIAPRKSAQLAEQLIADTVARQNIAPGTLTLHADRGTSMRSKSVAELLVDLEVTKSRSRPYVSDDNPFSEAQFNMFKYRPDFPARFGCIEDARAHCQAFFLWYSSRGRAPVNRDSTVNEYIDSCSGESAIALNTGPSSKVFSSGSVSALC